MSMLGKRNVNKELKNTSKLTTQLDTNNYIVNIQIMYTITVEICAIKPHS